MVADRSQRHNDQGGVRRGRIHHGGRFDWKRDRCASRELFWTVFPFCMGMDSDQARGRPCHPSNPSLSSPNPNRLLQTSLMRFPGEPLTAPMISHRNLGVFSSPLPISKRTARIRVQILGRSRLYWPTYRSSWCALNPWTSAWRPWSRKFNTYRPMSVTPRQRFGSQRGYCLPLAQLVGQSPSFFSIRFWTRW